LKELVGKQMQFSLPNQYKEFRFANLAAEYFGELKNILDQPPISIGQRHESIFSISSAYVAIDGTGSICIRGFNTKQDLFKSVFMGHEFLTESYLHHFERSNRKVFVALRNPLDVIVSNAFKLRYSYSNLYNHNRGLYLYEMISKTNPDLATTLKDGKNVIREQWGLVRLNNMEWFKGVASILKDYLLSYLAIRERVHTVKYEDLLIRSEPSLTFICNSLGLDISENKKSELWDKVGKPISPGHLFRPGSDKWRKYLSKQHMEILHSMNYEELLSELGYSIDMHVPRNQPEPLFLDQDLETFISELHTSYIVADDLPSRLTVDGTSVEMYREFLELLSSKHFQNILEAAVFN
jgi:hypothetical protein